jgi:hypothetical protein
VEIVIFKKDNLKLGIAYGFVAPIVAMFLYYAIVFADKISLSEYFFYMQTNRSLLTGVSSISLVANAVLFTVFINTYRDRTAKGVFVITLIYGIAVLLVKLLL